MHRSEAALWARIARAVTFAVPASWKQLIRDRDRDLDLDLVDGTLFDPIPERRDEFERLIIDEVLRMQRAGLSTAEAEPVAHVEPGDDRWKLIRDLRQAAHPTSAPWAPLAVESIKDEAGIPAPRRRIVISLDEAMSQDATVRELRRLWPTLIEQGSVRRTRPLEKRTLALLRHVCVEMPRDTTWRARWQAWQQRWEGERPEWLFAGQRQLNTAFHKAELSLTGENGGLRPFYDPVEWAASQPLGDFYALFKAGDKYALAAEKRYRILDARLVEILEGRLPRRASAAASEVGDD